MILLFISMVASKNSELYLSKERDDSLCAILVHVWQIDFITEQHQPLAKLDGSEYDTIRCTTVLTVVVKGLQQQFWGCGTGEVQTNNLVGSNMEIDKSTMKKSFFY